jgi:hypothetical protein
MTVLINDVCPELFLCNMGCSVCGAIGAIIENLSLWRLAAVDDTVVHFSPLLLRFTPKNPTGYITFGQGENSIKTGPKQPARAVLDQFD